MGLIDVHLDGDSDLVVPLCLAAALFGSACGGQPEDPRFTVRDSAGVAVAVSSAPRWGVDEAWRVGAAPILDLSVSGTGPPHEFDRVADATRLEDRSIVVADGGSSEIRLYSADGRFLSSIGGEGDGPGEFHRLRNVERIGADSLMVYSRPSRVTILTKDLSLVRTFEIDPLASGLRVLDAQTLVAQLADATLESYAGGNRLVRPQIATVRLDMDGELQDTVTLTRGSEIFMIAGELGASAARPLFGKAAVMTSRGGSIYVGSADNLEYSVFASEGRLRRVVRVPGYDLRLAAGEVASERRARLGADPQPFRLELDRALPDPATRAAYTEFLVDPDGYLWAGTQQNWAARRALEARAWHVFSPEGEWLGSLHTPPRFTVLEIGRDDVLGIYYDALDVEHVQLLPLTRSPGLHSP